MPGSSSNDYRLDYTGEPVTIVLKDEKRITVQQTIICRSSAFFQAAFTGDWRERTDGLITLYDCDQNDFLTYLHWLYTGELDLNKEESSAIKPEKPDRTPRQAKNIFITQATRSYIFGDFISDLRFRNALIDKLLAIPFFPDFSYLAAFWSKIPPQSGFGRLLVDIYACRGGYREIVRPGFS